ncbi:MAG: GH92 family glycosyl hydrolase [Prevotella sp.]|nr:GH92 family glycosyl hydrolase [Prevotella sp.]
MLHNEQLVGIYKWQELKEKVSKRIHQLEHMRQLCALNTMVGTDQANTTNVGLFGKGSEEHGQTLPAVLSPNGQNFWTPQTRDTEKKCVAPFYYADSLFQGIRNSHWIVGGCTQDYGSFTVATLGGSLRTTPTKRATRFSHDNEISHPHYYSVVLLDEHLRAELTATSHTAMLRVTPTQEENVHIVIQPNSDEGQGYVEIDTLNRTIYGYNPVHRIYQGWGEPAGFSGHFVLKYVDEIIDFGTFEGETTFSRHTSISQHPSVEKQLATPVGIYLTFRSAGIPLLFTMASSFTSREGALLNLKEETDNERISFDEMAQNLANSWISRLHVIDVEDPDTARVNQFYGALYRASFLPREFSDVDGCYYTDFSAWDTYRALHPLYNIIQPTLSGEMMQSLVDMYEGGGWLPIFPCWNSYTAAMIGDHCSAILADAYIKGVRNFDVGKAYEAMRKNAFESPTDSAEYKNGMGRRALSSYLKYGYIPLEDKVLDAFHTEEQTSRTLEYAFDDFAVAQMAKALGHEKDAQLLMKRSENWRNVINPTTGWADGRHANGSWEGSTDLLHRQPFITEGTICHYTWYVPHNIPVLIEVLGGKAAFEQKLDSMFGNPSSLISHPSSLYWHGNEPCHQIPLLFNYTANFWKTQQWVRHILDTEYNDKPGGLSGNDDAGQMSAWYLFAAMGFYPVCPTTTRYELASPTFQRVTLNLENGRHFVIEAPDASSQNIYVRSVTLNGQPLPTTSSSIHSPFSISHEDILKGSILHFEMGTHP